MTTDGDQDGGDDDKQTEMQRQLAKLDYNGETETLKRLSDEGRITLNHQIDSLNDIDSKAISVLRVNVVLLGLLLTAASLIADSQQVALQDFANNYTFFGVLALLASSAVAAVTYTASDLEVGIEADRIEDVIDSDLSEREFELAVAQSQIFWIRFNNRTNVINAPLITATNILLVVSLVHLALGVYASVVGQYVIAIAGSAWLLLLIFILATNIVSQVQSLVDTLSWSTLKFW